MAEGQLFDSNMILIFFIVLSIIELIILIRFRQLLGKQFDTGLKVITSRMKNPGRFLVNQENRTTEIEYRETQKVHHLIDDDLASPVIMLDKKAIYRGGGFNLPTYHLNQGQIKNTDPLQYIPSFSELESIGLGFNRALDAEIQREMAKLKKLFNEKFERIYLFSLGSLIGIIIVGLLVYNLNSFVDTAKSLFAFYQPFIDQAVGQIPHITPETGGNLVDGITKSISGSK